MGRRTTRSGRVGILMLVMTSGAAAPSAAQPAAPPASPRSATPELSLVAMDYAFRAPPRAPAGLVRVTLRNEGRRLHHAQLFRLDEGKRLSDLYPLVVARRGIGGLPGWAVPAGGPSAALPGTTIGVTTTLRPGRYAVICWVPAADGQPHFMKGMMAELEVTGTAAPAPAAATAATRVEVREYQVTFVSPPTAGPARLHVVNRGTQPHEVLIVRLAPGATLEDVARWSERGQPDGPRPVEDWQGVAAIAPGAEAWLELTWRPGRYAVFCLSPDTGDGRPHLLHGLHREFVVR